MIWEKPCLKAGIPKKLGPERWIDKNRAWKLEFPKSWVQKDNLTKTVPESWYTHKADQYGSRNIAQKLVDPESCPIWSQKCARKAETSPRKLDPRSWPTLKDGSRKLAPGKLEWAVYPPESWGWEWSLPPKSWRRTHILPKKLEVPESYLLRCQKMGFIICMKGCSK